jgi:PDZ domain-containing protein
VTAANPSHPQPRLVGLLAVAVVLLLMAGAVGLVVIGAQGYYALVPGSAPVLTDTSLCRVSSNGARQVLPDGRPCVGISVPAERGHAINGSILMVSVLVGPAAPFRYLLGKVGLLSTFDPGAQLVPAQAVLGTTPPGQLNCQAAQQMAGSTSSAAVVALKRLGYRAVTTDLGAQLFEVAPGSPAATAGLRCNDVVIDVNDRPIRTSTDLSTAIRAGAPGETLRITVQRRGSDGKLQTETRTVRLTAPPTGPGSGRAAEPFLGVVSMTRTTYSLPFDVNVEVGDIGGPSAGLALTLAILDILSGGNLTGGHAVAATGTIALDGTVGDVGGVAQKAVAVRRAGANVFFVPADQLNEAQGGAGAMKVYPVKTLQQALDDLEALGGQVPPPSPASGAP